MIDDIDGERAVYPGHPLTVAWLITRAYPSLEAATRSSARTGYPDALANSDIPGAGGNVYSALDFLREVLVERRPIDKAIEHANDVWARCDGQRAGDARLVERWRQGQEQADRIVDRLRMALETWR